MNPIRIAIHGAAGRMGRRLVALTSSDPALELVAAIDSAENPHQGEDAGNLAGVGPKGITIRSNLCASPDVVVDFSVSQAVVAIVDVCVERKLPLVVATTGLDESQSLRLRQAAATIPLLWSPNMSMAVNLSMKLAEVAAKALSDRDADVEILERHHRFKKFAQRDCLEVRPDHRRGNGHTAHRHGRPWTPRRTTARGDRLSRHPDGRQPRGAHDCLRHARRDARTHRPGHQPRLLRPGRWRGPSSSLEESPASTP